MQTNYYPTTVTPQKAPLGFEMNHLYLSPSQQQVNRPGMFLKRTERIDWRRIAAVDVDRISRDMDFQALQDNLEQITLCNIDTEIDTRAMDPNFIKLYKMAQLTIEYLLLCQDQITTQVGDYEQLKSQAFREQTDARRQIEGLKHELADTKKELKKRRKMLETQQRMLMAQNSNYHTCPVCTHAFLSVAYLQAHMTRRHPDYDGTRRREHDIDAEKQNQHLKDELNKKNKELHDIKSHKAVDEEKLRHSEANIRQLKDQIRELTTKNTILDDRVSHVRSSIQNRSPSPRRHEGDVSELLKENKNLYAQIEQLKKAEIDRQNEEKKFRQSHKQKIEELLIENSNLKQNLQLLQNASGDTGHLSGELITFQNRYNEEKLRRKKLQDELQEANNQLAQYGKQPPPVVDRKSPVRRDDSPVQTRTVRPIQTTEIILPEYCLSLVERLKSNPKYLTKYRDAAKKQFIEELEEYENLGISETDTRLTDLDFRTKMESVLQTRRNIQNDLPEFERIRADLNRTLDRSVNERLDVRRSITSVRSTGSKLVTFEDEHQRKKPPASIYDNTKKPSLDQHRVPPKSNYDRSRPIINNNSDEDVTISNAIESDDEDPQPTRPGVRTDIQPPPRKNPPPSKTTSGVSALVIGNIKPSTAIPATVVKAKPTTERFNSDSENENPVPLPSSNDTEKKRFIDRKLHEENTKGQKPTVNAIAKAFLPSRESLATQNNDNDDDDDDDDESDTFTTLHTNPPAKPSNGPQLSGRESVNNNHLSSGDASQHTYDSMWKSQMGKGVETRRPPTADSAKTSNMDSDDNLDGEESN